MKKKTRIALLGLLAVSGLLIWAAAAGNDAQDSLVSLSYLNGTYASAVDAAVEERLDDADQTLLDAAKERDSGGAGVLVAEYADTWTEQRLKENDILVGYTGLSAMSLAGDVTVVYSSGAVVDATAGAVVPSGTVLTANHRYLVAEDTSALFTVTSATAVVDYAGYYTLTLSDAVDYNAMASALKTMHLFRGSFTGYGQGFDLEKVPTRLQALIMFIRVLGEEDAALSWSGTIPFTDLAKGSEAAKYVGYAYEKGYTNGFTATQWRPGQAVSVNQYTEFVLRALGYSSVANTDLSDTLARAQSCGLLTGREASALAGTPFLRAQLVYISYYALDTTAAGTSKTLGDLLMSKGVYTAEEAAAARHLVPGDRTLG